MVNIPSAINKYLGRVHVHKSLVMYVRSTATHAFSGVTGSISGVSKATLPLYSANVPPMSRSAEQVMSQFVSDNLLAKRLYD